MIKKIICCVVITIFSVPTLFAFGGISHELITQSAVINTKLLEKFPEKVQKSLERDLVKSCNYADETWYERFDSCKSNSFGTPRLLIFLPEKNIYDQEHSYAFSSMIYEYDNALSLWKESKRVESIQTLGRAIHCLQDVCCISYEMYWLNNAEFSFKAGKKLFGGKNISYENKVDEYIKNNFDSIVNKYKNYDFRQNARVENVASAYNILSEEIFGEKGKNNEQIEIEIEEIEVAHKITCEIIYLFFKEIGIKL